MLPAGSLREPLRTARGVARPLTAGAFGGKIDLTETRRCCYVLILFRGTFTVKKTQRGLNKRY